MPLPWTTASSHGKDHLQVGRIDLLLERDADRPGQPALAESLPEGRAQAVSGIGEHAAKAHACGADPVDLAKRDLGRSRRAGSLVQLSGRNSRSPTMTGTSPDARVSHTSVWQFAFLPSAEAYCGATPTE